MEEPDNLEKNSSSQTSRPTARSSRSQIQLLPSLASGIERPRAQRQQEGSPVWIHPGSPSLILAVLAHNRMMVDSLDRRPRSVDCVSRAWSVSYRRNASRILQSGAAALCKSLQLWEGSRLSRNRRFCRALGQLGSTQQDRPVILKPRCDQALALAGLDCRRLGDLIVGVAIPIGVGSAPVSSQRSTASVLTGRTA
ncbi:hypothetical protein FDECE_1923 [Fusarium decemcellulare]|nr:hypothetical protein FDECE_1923 [Fusarium decemcellulare]